MECKQNNPLRLLLVFLCAIMVVFPVAGQALSRQKLELTRLFPDFPAKIIQRVIQRNGQYFVLDAGNHRVAVFNERKEFVRQIGGIGQAPGEFYSPNDMAVDRSGNLYIRDGLNRRFQVLDPAGKPISQFPNLPDANGLAVNSKGEIFLGQPQKGKLISVYDRSGRFLRSFGELHKISDFYGPALTDRDREYAYAINRIRMAVDASDHVYVAFHGAPVFQKYDPSGKLVFEKRIEASEASKIITEFAARKESPVRRGIDDVPTPLIITAIAVHPRTGKIFIAFQWDRAWIYVADASGRGLVVLEPPLREILFQNIDISEDGGSLLFTLLSTVKNNEMYQARLAN